MSVKLQTNGQMRKKRVKRTGCGTRERDEAEGAKDGSDGVIFFFGRRPPKSENSGGTEG